MRGRRRLLLGAGLAAAAAGFWITGIGLAWRPDPETGQMFWSLPRDVLYQWHTALSGVLLAACVAWFLPLNWTRGKSAPERIAANVCLAVLWAIIIYAMARH